MPILSFRTVSATLALCLALVFSTTLTAQSNRAPVVSKVRQRLVIESRYVGEAAKGDMLTVIAEQDNLYFVRTPKGDKGWVNIANTAKMAEAVSVFDDMIRQDPRNGILHTLRASAHWAAGDSDKAIADYGKAIQVGHNSPQVYVERGMFYALSNDFDKAIADYNTAIKQKIKGDAVYVNRGAAYMAKKDYDKAIKDFTEALRQNSDKPSTYYQRAVAYRNHGQMKEAISDFTAALKRDSKNVQALNGRGYAYFQSGDNKKAITDFTAVLKLSPKSALAYNNRGYNYQLLGDYKNALADYEKAIEFAPKYALAYQNKAWLLSAADDAKIRNGKTAIEVATKACELREFKEFSDLKALAAAHAENKDFAKAMEWQKKAIELADKEQKPFEKEVLEKYEKKEPFRLTSLGGK